VAASVVGEASMLIEGRAVDHLWAQGQPIPGWAWLNALAHRPVGEVGDLLAVACDRPDDQWADAVVDIALALSEASEVEATDIQSDLFVPAELDALAEQNRLDGPDQLVRRVRLRLISDRRRRPPKSQESPDRSDK
jgi:hypothetical protein